MPSKQKLLLLASKVHPKYKPVWDGLSEDDQAALAGYFLPHGSKKSQLEPTRPNVVKFYCPFASQCKFPSDHRYCINVYVGCGYTCQYCYAASYEPESARYKKNFLHGIDRDMKNLEEFDVPPAAIHLSNSVDPFQPLEQTHGHTRYALEQILDYRHRFTTVTVLTKNPLLSIKLGYVDLFKKLLTLPRSHSRSAEFKAERIPAFQMHVSLAFWNAKASALYDPDAPSIEERREGIIALRDAGVPVILRIDPLFPRSPISTNPSKTLQDFRLVEARTIGDLRNLVIFSKRVGVRHVVYSPLKIVQPRGRPLSDTMKTMREVYRVIAVPKKLDWHGGSWRLPKEIAYEHVVSEFLMLCRQFGVNARFCMDDLLETR